MYTICSFGNYNHAAEMFFLIKQIIDIHLEF